MLGNAAFLVVSDLMKKSRCTQGIGVDSLLDELTEFSDATIYREMGLGRGLNILFSTSFSRFVVWFRNWLGGFTDRKRLARATILSVVYSDFDLFPASLNVGSRLGK